MKGPVTKIVLLGSGYVTVWAYSSLWKYLRKKIVSGEVAITVLSPDNCHVFHGWTAESITGIIREKNRLSPLSEILPHARLIYGKATEIDTRCQQVHYTDPAGTTDIISYDHLLYGIGSFDNPTVKGMGKYGYQIKSHTALHVAKQRIMELLDQAALHPHRAKKLLDITIAGAGLTGIELAANIAEMMDVVKKQIPALKKISPVIRVICSTDSILPSLQHQFPRMVNYTENVLRKYGMEIIHHAKVIEVTAEGFRTSDGAFFGTNMLISTIGQSRSILKGTELMARDKENRIYTNQFLQLHQQTNIWGGGDACHVKHCKTLEACPSNALWAMKHGKAIGKNIARSIRNQPLQFFMYKGLGQTASLGIGKGIGELYGIQFTGWLAWMLRWCFFNFYMPSRKVMWNAIYDWMWLLLKQQRIGYKEMAPSQLSVSMVS